MKKIYLLISIFVVASVASTPVQASGISKKTAQTFLPADVKNNRTASTNSSIHYVNDSYHNVNARVNPVNHITSIYADNFDGSNDTSSLQARGYLTYYRGVGIPGTTATWYQGDDLRFPAFNGPTTGYVCSDFNSVIDSNDIDNWMVLPALNVTAGDLLSFYSRSVAASIYPDSIKVMYSDAGDSVPEATSWVLLDNFVVNIGGAWEYKTFAAPTSSTTGRFAIRYAVVRGGPLGVNSFYIGIDQLEVFTPSAVDANLISISAPVSSCQLSTTESVSVTVVNNGLNALATFDLSFSVDAGSPVTETFNGNLNPGDTLYYTFTATADLSVLGNHTVDCIVAAAGDGNTANDATSVSVINKAPWNPTTAPYLMGFEPADDLAGLAVEDANVDGAPWALAYNPNFSVASHGGDYCLRVGAVADINDWVYTGCLDLTSGVSYYLSYWTYLFDVASPGDIDVSIGMDQNSAAMTQQLVATSTPDAQWIETTTVFTVAASGTYYVGFHGTSATTAILRLDDIYIVDVVTGIHENNVQQTTGVYPNPNNGNLIVSSKTSAKNSLVEVFNTVGQKVYSASFTNLNKQQLDLSDLNNGWYNVRISSDSFVENHAMQINK